MEQIGHERVPIETDEDMMTRVECTIVESAEEIIAHFNLELKNNLRSIVWPILRFAYESINLVTKAGQCCLWIYLIVLSVGMVAICE